MAKLTALDLLKQGVEAWNQWRAEHPEVTPSLFWASLKEWDLRRVNFSRVKLVRAHLEGANLREANLGGANLGGTYLSGADLSGADLSQADLSRADLSQADLSRADLREANLRSADLSQANLEGADLDGANLEGTYLKGAKIDDTTRLDEKWRLVWRIVNQGGERQDFSGINLRGANLKRANLREANFRSADLSQANLEGASLEGANLQEANLQGANLQGNNLQKANLQKANLQKANLQKANLQGANLTRATLRGADLTGADLTGADLTGAVLKGPKLAARAERAVYMYDSAFPYDEEKKAVSPALFTAYFPPLSRPETWYNLLVYAHTPDALGEVLLDARKRLPAEEYSGAQAMATDPIAEGAEITVVPEMPGFRFNPARARFDWLEDWHRVEFRMMASPQEPGFVLNQPTQGHLSFYVGPVLVAEINIWSFVTRTAPLRWEAKKQTTDSYQAIFVSYSHQDARIIEQLEKAYKVLGTTYLRDVHILRSGEKWNEALLGKIDEADIFQLCWSKAAKTSEYVRREWRHALGLGREAFIRPVYWEQPMPEPPAELAGLHFAHYELT